MNIRTEVDENVVMIKIFLVWLFCLTEGHLDDGLLSVSITRHHKGDLFFAQGEKCYKDLCSGLSSGTAKPNGNNDCECKCVQNHPVFRDDLNVCVDDIKECTVLPFASNSAIKKIPYVFLPLKGQIVYPSAEIIVSDEGTPVCVVSGGQFLGRSGWLNLRNNSEMEPPFRLFRDEGKTYLQWLGEASLRMAMEGRIILVHLMCKDASFPEEPKIFTPCIAFRVAGNPTVKEVTFATDVHLKEEYNGGLSIREYIAIGICSLLLAVVYVASVFLYLQWRRRKHKLSKKSEDAQLTLGEEGVIKSNPLLQAKRHLSGGQDNAGYISESNSCCSDNEQSSDLLCLDDDENSVVHQNVQTSAIVHPCGNEYGENVFSQDSNTIEKLPEENVSIVETLEVKEDHPEITKVMGCINGRRKLYFNPSYFEPDLLKAPPPAALEFLIKIREVIAIAKHKMSAKKFSPSLLGIPEEDSSQKTVDSNASQSNLQKPKDCQTQNSLTSENFRLASSDFCCTMDSKQRIIQRWLEDVPVMIQIDQQNLKDTNSQKLVIEEIRTLNKSKLWQINESKNIINNSIREVPIPKPPLRQEKKKSSTKGKAPPLPPQALKPKINEKDEDIKKTDQKESLSEFSTITNSTSKVNNARLNTKNDSSLSAIKPPPSPPPMPSFCQEKHRAPIPQTKDYTSPVTAKNLMDAVIKELSGFKKKDKSKDEGKLKKEQEEKEENSNTETALNDNEVEKTRIREEHPSKVNTNNSLDDHEYEVILLNGIPKPNSDQDQKDINIYNLPELLSKSEKNEGYSLVSEVYVNDGYSSCSGESPPSSYSSVESDKIKYDMPLEKPGRLTIHVNDSPDQYKSVMGESDNFEPDTLDRKPRKKLKQPKKIKENTEDVERYSNQKFLDMECSIKSNNSENNESFTDSLERPSIMLRSNGSFKGNTVERKIDDLLRNFNWNSLENFGSLREIYEAKSKHHKRRTETTSLIDSVNSDNDRISTLSWSEERRNKLLHRGIILHIPEIENMKNKSNMTVCRSHSSKNQCFEKTPSLPPKPRHTVRSRSQSPSARSNCASPSSKSSQRVSSPQTYSHTSSPRCVSPPLPPPRSLPISVPSHSTRSANSSPITTNNHKNMCMTSPFPSPNSANKNNNKILSTPPPRSLTPPSESLSFQPSSLPPYLTSYSEPVEISPPLPPRNTKPPLPPKNLKRQRSTPNKFASRPLPPLPHPRPLKTNSSSPPVSYKDPETLSTLSGASMDSLNSSEYEAFYTLPYDEYENGDETESQSVDNKNSRSSFASNLCSDSSTLASLNASQNIFDGSKRTHDQFQNQRQIRTNKPAARRIEDSGYLSTDSNESCHPKLILPPKIPEKIESYGSQNSETEESFGDGASESGAESTATDSFFYGNFQTGTKTTSEDATIYPTYSLKLSDIEVNSDTERHCVPIMVRP